MTWYERDPARAQIEFAELHRRYPQAVFTEEHGEVVVRLVIQGRYALYASEIRYGDDFPWESPKSYIRYPELPSGTPHYFSDQSLCLYEWDEVGPQTSGRNIADWTVKYVFAFEQWCDTNTWPSLK